MDLLDSASPEERDLARRVIEHCRIAQARGISWVEIWPRMKNGAFDYPVPIAHEPHKPVSPSPVVTATVVEVRSESATVAQDNKPQLSHVDNNGHPDTDDPLPPTESELDRAILAALTHADKPLKATVIARRAGLTYNAHFRRRMAELKRRSVVRPVGDSQYWLASRPLPQD